MNVQSRRHAAEGSITLGQQVYLALRGRLLVGEWLPGTKLTLRGLAEELRTSVQPVREAINRLTAERALLLRPNHSVMLPPVAKPILDEIWSIRILLEGEVARLCASKLTDEDFAEIDKIHFATRSYQSGGGPRSEKVAAVQRLAMVLAEKSGSSVLVEQVTNLRVRSAPYYAAAMDRQEENDKDFIAFSVRMQSEFIDALKRRDAASACLLRGADLYTYQRYIYRRLGLE